MAFLASRLRRAGFRTLNLDYSSRRKPLAALADEIDAPVERFAATAETLHFVTHSMGGLLARVYLDRKRPASLGRVVMLGPPHGGSEFADLLHRRWAYRHFYGPAGQQLTTWEGRSLLQALSPVGYPLGIIAGDRPVVPLLSRVLPNEPSDGIVTVRSTRLAGMADHLVVDAGHSFLMYDPTAIAATIAFLKHGRFTGRARQGPGSPVPP